MTRSILWRSSCATRPSGPRSRQPSGPRVAATRPHQDSVAGNRIARLVGGAGQDVLKTVLFGLGTTVVATLALALAVRLPADAAALLGAFVISGVFVVVFADVVLRKAGGDYNAARAC